MGDRDALLALSDDDASNALVCMVAKALGTPMAVARLHNPHYVGLLEGGVSTPPSPLVCWRREASSVMSGGESFTRW